MLESCVLRRHSNWAKEETITPGRQRASAGSYLLRPRSAWWAQVRQGRGRRRIRVPFASTPCEFAQQFGFSYSVCYFVRLNLNLAYLHSRACKRTSAHLYTVYPLDSLIPPWMWNSGHANIRLHTYTPFTLLAV